MNIPLNLPLPMIESILGLIGQVNLAQAKQSGLADAYDAIITQVSLHKKAQEKADGSATG